MEMHSKAAGASDVPLESPRILAALRNVATGVTAARGDEVFRQLVQHLAATLDVDLAMVGVLDEQRPGWVRTLAVVEQGRITENTAYPLEGTPCQSVVGQEFEFIPDRVAELFPGDAMMVDKGLSGYAAYPLFDCEGEALGLIVVSDRRALHNREVIEATLRIFSVRAAAEVERQRSERAVLAREEQYRAIFDASVDGLVLWNPVGHLVDVNTAFAEMHGYTRDELLNMDPRVLVHPDCWHQFDAFMDTLRTGRPFHTEARDVRRDGSVFDIEVHGVRMEYLGAPHLLGIARDISERRLAEARRGELEAQLRQAQKMEAIGHLTGGIAHDFNNILTTILGYAALAQERPEVDNAPRLRNHLAQIQTAGERARDLIRQMLTFSRGERGAPRLVSLARLVEETLQLFASSFPSTIRLSTRAAESLPLVRADPIQIEQVLMNLCINARDAIVGNGEIRIEIARQKLNWVVCSACQQWVDGDYVALSVIDTGHGIPPEVVERMFEPFFTTKDVGHGSGMGLATAHGIVHDHQGHIIVDRPASGAAIHVLLPVACCGEQPPDEQPNQTSLHQRAQGRVLLVEDQSSVAAFMRELLESRGFEVEACANGEEALQRVGAADRGFDLIVSDQTMPRLTGLALAERLRGRGDRTPVVLYTGYAETIDPVQAERAGVAAVLAKPLDLGELMSVVQRLLEGSGPA